MTHRNATHQPSKPLKMYLGRTCSRNNRESKCLQLWSGGFPATVVVRFMVIAGPTQRLIQVHVLLVYTTIYSCFRSRHSTHGNHSKLIYVDVIITPYFLREKTNMARASSISDCVLLCPRSFRVGIHTVFVLSAWEQSTRSQLSWDSLRVFVNAYALLSEGSLWGGSLHQCYSRCWPYIQIYIYIYIYIYGIQELLGIISRVKAQCLPLFLQGGWGGQ